MLLCGLLKLFIIHLIFLGRPTTQASKYEEMVINVAAESVCLCGHLQDKKVEYKQAKFEEESLSHINFGSCKHVPCTKYVI